ARAAADQRRQAPAAARPLAVGDDLARSMSMLAIVLLLGTTMSSDYHRVANEHGVTVYKNDHLGGIALAAEGDLPGPPDKVRRVLTDYASHPRWNKHLKECRILQHGNDWLVVY